MEGKDKAIEFTPEGKKAILAKVIHAEQYEKFLGKKYVGTKRFGLDGGEAMIPALESVIKYGAHYGVREIRSEEHTSELQSLMRISYAVFCLKKKKKTRLNNTA